MHIPYQSARLSLRRRATPRPMVGVFSRLQVGQKLSLMTLALALPLGGLLAVLVGTQQRQLREFENQLSGLQATQPLAALQVGLFNAADGAVLRRSQLTQEGARATDGSLRNLRGVLGPLGQRRVQAVDRDWKLMQGAAAAQNRVAVIAAYENLIRRHQQPLIDDLLAETGLSAERDPGIAALLAANQRELSRVATEVQLLMLLAQAAAEGDPVTGWVQSSAANLTLLERSLQAYEDTLRRAYDLQPGLERRVGAATAAVSAGARQSIRATREMLASYQADPEVIRRYEELRSTLRGAYGRVNAEIGAQIVQRRDTLRRTLALQLLALVAVLAGAAALLVAITRSIVRPLGQLTMAGQALAGGDLQVRVPVTGADELAQLGEVFNDAVTQLRASGEASSEELRRAAQLQRNVGAFLDVTMDIAEGDLTRRGEVTEDVLGNVVDSINLMTEELAQTLREVRGASVTVTSGSQAMLQTTAQIAQGTQVTTEQTARIAQQAREISQEIGQMAAIARASAEASRRTLAASTQGQQAVSATLEGMSSIRESSQDAEQRMQALAARSDEIGQIVEAVSHIASQVNLLSLHASIEAAGAGPAGTRFAIVAEEVRTLADESAAATARIAGLITALRSEIQGVAQGIRANAAQVQQGYALAGTAGASLREIGDLAGITAQLAQNISSATERQVQGVGEVSRGMQDIASVAGSSQQSAARAREAAQQLEGLAQALDSRLAHFRLD